MAQSVVVLLAEVALLKAVDQSAAGRLEGVAQSAVVLWAAVDPWVGADLLPLAVVQSAADPSLLAADPWVVEEGRLAVAADQLEVDLSASG